MFTTDIEPMVSDIAFSPAVKAAQARKGSRAAVAHRDWADTIDDNLAAFIGTIDTAFLVTASADGQPYAQHRGGPKGFIRVLGPRTLGFADYRGNRQYISTGNLSENPKAYLFLIDFATQARVKIWGTARVVDDDPELIARLMPEGYRAKPEQAILFDVTAWDANCRQHITQKFNGADVAEAISRLNSRIEDLEAEIKRLRGA